MDTPVLSPEQLLHFAEQGYVHVPAALSPAFVERVKIAIWRQLEARCGIVKDAPHTWRAEHGLINKDVIDRMAGVEIEARLTGAVNQLLGEGRWRPLKTLGGLLLTMPDPAASWERVLDWHFDNDPHSYLEGVTELMLFTFYSSVGPRGGGTLLLSGSPRLVERYIRATAEMGTPDDLPLTNGLAKWHPWLADLMRSGAVGSRPTATLMEAEVDVHGVPLRIIELMGEPGDAVLCHPAMLHAVSANCSALPRIMRRTNFRRRR